jgi:ribosomal protein S18 acetylase RimI-like enzyme
MIREMDENDIAEVVKIHLEGFPGFFLTFLGRRFLALYYTAIAKWDECVRLVYIDEEGVPVGFVVGAVNPAKFYSRILKRDWFRFAFAAINAVCRRPSIVPRLLRAFKHPSGNPVGDNVAGLFSIGVLQHVKREGIGKILTTSFLDEAKTRGCTQVFLTTDRENNLPVNHFYTRLGFSLGRHYITPEGRHMNEYWISL